VGSWQFLFRATATNGKVAYKLDTLIVAQGVNTAATVSLSDADFTAPYVAVTGISFSPTAGTVGLNSGNTTLALGNLINFNAADASNRLLTWASGDTGKATVDTNGTVTGVAPGSVTITARSVDNASATATFTLTVGQGLTVTITGPSQLSATNVTLTVPSSMSYTSANAFSAAYSGASASWAWYLDGAALSSGVSSSATSSTCALTPSALSLAVGYHVIKAVAKDSSTGVSHSAASGFTLTK
jgi:hypothetical protein